MSNYTIKEPNCKCSTCHLELYKEKRSIRKGTKHFFCSVECHGKFKSNQSYLEMCERVGDDFKTWLNQKYNVEKLNSREMANLAYGKVKNGPNITVWMKKLNIPVRSRTEAVELQWVDNEERKKQASTQMINMWSNDDGTIRERINIIMQTDEYKLKQSIAKTGEKNGMYGVKGDKHSKWNPLLTTEDRLATRKVPANTAWRKEVFERDDYTCQTCISNKGGNLVAHHLNGYHWDKENRFNTDNGTTLCDSCHKDFHSQYGYGNNTKEQFEEYQSKALVTSTGAFSMH